MNHRRTALSHLYTVLDGKGTANPLLQIPQFVQPQPEPRGLPLEDVRRVLAAIPDPALRARLSVLAWTGMRPSELYQMTRADVDLEARCCWVRTRKGGRVHMVPFQADGLRAWQDLIQYDAWGPLLAIDCPHGNTHGL